MMPKRITPLPEILRPKILNDIIGQEKLLSQNGWGGGESKCSDDVREEIRSEFIAKMQKTEELVREEFKREKEKVAKELEEKDKVLEEKDREIKEKDEKLEEKEKELEKLENKWWCLFA